MTNSLTVNVGGSLAVPTGSTLKDVTVNGILNFLGTSLSTGTLTVNSTGQANATDLTSTSFVDFGRIFLASSGTMNNGDRNGGGFRYRLSGSPNGFQNNNGGYTNVSGTIPFATLP